MSQRLHRQDAARTFSDQGERITVGQAEARERQAHRDARSAAQQLAQLDARLGVGVGATRERARLYAEISQALA